MSKLYWKLRQSMSLKSLKCGAIMIRNKRTPLRKPFFGRNNFYPLNRWGSGYWRNK